MADTPDTISIEQLAQQIAPQLAELLADRMPDSFKAVNNLIALAVDPKAVKRNLRALHDAMAAASAAQVKLAADRAAFDEYKATETAEIEEQKKAAVSTYAMVRSREAALENREARCAAREAELRGGYQPRNHPDDDDGWTAPQGSGMGRTFTERRSVRHDDLGQPYAAHTTLTRTVTGPE